MKTYPKCNECGEELEGGENYCPICGNQLVLKSERGAGPELGAVSGWASDIGHTTNTARLKMNGERRAVEILLETSIRDKDRLRVLISETLRAASRAEHDVRCMDDEAVTKHLKEHTGTVHSVKWTPIAALTDAGVEPCSKRAEKAE